MSDQSAPYPPRTPADVWANAGARHEQEMTALKEEIKRLKAAIRDMEITAARIKRDRS